MILVGMGTPNLMLPISEASAREIDLVPTWRYANCYPHALQLLQACKRELQMPNLVKLITHRYEGVENVPVALNTASRSADEEHDMVIKVAVINSD